MSDPLELDCLRSAERYCRERAAMAWTDKERDRWNRLAEWNRRQREMREQPPATV